MHLLTRAALCCLAALSLAACATTGTTTTTAQAAFDTACRNEPLAYAAFVLAATVRPVSSRTLATVDAAHAEASAICASPPADLASGVVAITKAYATVRDARDAASRKV